MFGRTVRYLLLMGAIAFPFCGLSIPAQENDTKPRTPRDGIASLREQLENGLRATTKADKDYINQVIQLVETGRLSKSMVNYVYKLSLQRRPKSPLPYFQRVLRALAKVNI